MNCLDFGPLGFGVGLRRPHYAPILDAHPTMDWFEVISENLMVEGGRPLQILEDVRAHYPIVMHGVSLSIGSSDPLNRTYLDALRCAARRFKPAWVSDHLCWTGVNGRNLHDLLPLKPKRRFGTSPTVSGRFRKSSNARSSSKMYRVTWRFALRGLRSGNF
jgi:uncharacterized protein (UPF0276 family)